MSCWMRAFSHDYPGIDYELLLDKAGNHETSDALAQCGVTPDVRFTTRDDYAIMAMVECGLGVSLLPELILRRVPYRIAIRKLDTPRYRDIALALPGRRMFRPRRASSCAIWIGATHRRHPPETRDLTIGRDLCIITTKSLIFCEICPPASGDREESNVTYTVDDTMKKLLGAPEAVAVLERFFPKILKNPALQMTAAMTLRQVAGFAQSGLTADSLAEIDAQLRALPSSDG